MVVISCEKHHFWQQLMAIIFHFTIGMDRRKVKAVRTCKTRAAGSENVQNGKSHLFVFSRHSVSVNLFKTHKQTLHEPYLSHCVMIQREGDWQPEPQSKQPTLSRSTAHRLLHRKLARRRLNSARNIQKYFFVQIFFDRSVCKRGNYCACVVLLA